MIFVILGYDFLTKNKKERLLQVDIQRIAYSVAQKIENSSPVT